MSGVFCESLSLLFRESWKKRQTDSKTVHQSIIPSQIVSFPLFLSHLFWFKVVSERQEREEKMMRKSNERRSRKYKIQVKDSSSTICPLFTWQNASNEDCNHRHHHQGLDEKAYSGESLGFWWCRSWRRRYTHTPFRPVRWQSMGEIHPSRQTDGSIPRLPNQRWGRRSFTLTIHLTSCQDIIMMGRRWAGDDNKQQREWQELSDTLIWEKITRNRRKRWKERGGKLTLTLHANDLSFLLSQV